MEAVKTLMSQFSADNTTVELAMKNNEKFEQAIRMLDSILEDKISSEDLPLVLRLIHSVASNCLFKNQPVARKYLIAGKRLVESELGIDDKMTTESIIETLNLKVDLRHYYVGILYLLGRVVFYFENLISKNQAKMYLERSKIIGTAYGFFEGFLSVRSGLALLYFTEIEKDKPSDDEKIRSLIELYKQLRDDPKSYIMGFDLSPSNRTVPASDAFNRTACCEQLLKLLSYGVLISDDTQYYADELKRLVDKPEFYVDLANPSLNKKWAFCNAMGFLFLAFGVKNICIDEIRERFCGHLPELRCLNNVRVHVYDFLEMLFKQQKSVERDFIKADAYLGLSLVGRLKNQNDSVEACETKYNSMKTKSSWFIEELKKRCSQVNN